MPIFKKTAKGTVKYFPIPFAFAGQSPDFAKLPAHTSTLPAAYRAVCRFRPHKRMPDCIGHRGPHAVRNAVSSKMPVQSPGKPPALSDKNIQPDILPADTPSLQVVNALENIVHTDPFSSSAQSVHCQHKVSVKAFIILLGVPVRLDQTVTFFQFGRWFIIPCCHRFHFLSVAKFSESAPKEISPL